MSNYQYGGYDDDYRSGPAPQLPPINVFNASQPQQLPEYPAPSQTSPPRRPVGPYRDNSYDSLGAPPPPAHGSGAASPTRYRHTPTTSREQNSYAGGLAVDNVYNARMTTPSPDFDSEPYDNTYTTPSNLKHHSQNSMAPLSAHARGMGTNSPSPPRGMPAPGMLAYGYGYDENRLSGRGYRGDGYDGFVDPQDIADDADDGFEDQPSSQRSRFGAGAAAGTAAGAGTVPGMLNVFGSRDQSGNYGPVRGGGAASRDAEKSDWLRENGGGRKRLKYIFGILGVLIIIGIVAGVVGGIMATNPSSSSDDSSSSSSSASAAESGGKLNIDSPEVKELLGNKNLHKVFPSMDYTPLNAQYPDCLTNPPSQDNVTLDVAMLSQLTPSIRLYGTDCDQTEMVMTAIEKLKMEDSLKVWLGVWLDSNATSTNRGLDHMYELLDKYPEDRWAGVIIGNEVLFREDMTEAELAQVLSTARSKIKSKGYNIPVSTSDLGDNWTAQLAADSDIVMANVHPFFAGVKPAEAPGWTWSFWTTHDEVLAKDTGPWPKSIVSETGWPSEGGNNCGTGYKCPSKTDGAIAGIDQMNEFMEGWICPSLANGTTFFWFEAFDEPWKNQFNDPTVGNFWEPHWGLLDVNRNLKDGVKIPDCGGKTVDKPW